jgi:hypothetical protein
MAAISEATGAERRSIAVALRGLGVAILPVVAIWELFAIGFQHRHVPKTEDWGAAASAAIAVQEPGDVILVSPRWAEQHGRMAVAGFHVSLATVPETPLDRFFDVHVAARPDLETYSRALELSIRGKDDPQTKGWSLVSEQRFGDVSLRILKNPAPQKLVRDLTDEIDATASVAHVGPNGPQPCRWEEGGTQHMPALFAGPVPPPNRFLCPPNDPNWTYVGPTVITDLAYVPRRCIFMHPHEHDVTTIELPPKPIGRRVVGWVGIHVYQERELKFAPILARITIGGKEVASVTHHDGDGWLRFEGSTEEFAGQNQPVKLELWADQGLTQFRTACMAAQLRD